MRCYICNKALTDKEVVFNEDLQQDEPCTTCLDVALDAAYSGGFSLWGDDMDEVYVLDEDYYPDADNSLSFGYTDIGGKEDEL